MSSATKKIKILGDFQNMGWVPNEVKKYLGEAAANKALGRRRR